MASFKALITVVIVLTYNTSLYAKRYATNSNYKGSKQTKMLAANQNIRESNDETSNQQISEDEIDTNDYSHNADFDNTANRSEKNNKNRRNLRSSQKDWTLKTPLWFYAFNKSSFFVSSELHMLQMKADFSSHIDTPYYLSSSSKAKKDQVTLHHSLGYGFEIPLFLMLELNQNISDKSSSSTTSSQPYKATTTSEYSDSTQYTGVSEPKVSFGGVVTNSLFSFGGKISSTFATEAYKSQETRDGSGNSKYIKNSVDGGSEFGSASGGASNGLTAFGSFDLSGVHLGFGFNVTKFEESKSEEVVIYESTGKRTSAKYTYKSRNESKIYLGIEFEKLERLGIRIWRSDIDSVVEASSKQSPKKYNFNGIEVGTKFKFNPYFAIRPSLYYGKVEYPSEIKKEIGSDSIDINITGVKLGFDLSF